VQPLAAVAGGLEKEAIGPAAGPQVEWGRVDGGLPERSVIAGKAAV
jgi:hypothetical protein